MIIVPRATIVHFEGVSDGEIRNYEAVIGSRGYPPHTMTVAAEQALAFWFTLEQYSQLWLGVSFFDLEKELTGRTRNPYTPREAHGKIGNLLSSAISKNFRINPRKVAYVLGGETTPSFIRDLIIEIDRCIAGIGGVIEGRTVLQAANNYTPPTVQLYVAKRA